MNMAPQLQGIYLSYAVSKVFFIAYEIKWVDRPYLGQYNRNFRQLNKFWI